MLSKLQKRNSEGFTIIEVMIVLAIAALILLIVLLAVPALQRGSRNTQRKNDVSALASAIGDFINNHNGTGPTSQADLNGTGATDEKLVKNIKLGYYDPTNIWYQGTAPGPPSVSPQSSTPSASVLTTDGVIVVKGAVCNGNVAALGSTRSYAILYAVESNSGNGNGQEQCVEAS